MERGEGKPRNGDHSEKNFRYKGKWRNGGEMWGQERFLASRDEGDVKCLHDEGCQVGTKK